MYQEDELIEGCIKGNSICQQIIYERYLPKMLGICMRYAGGGGQARDMVHEGFIRIYLHIGKFRRQSSLETWMSRIMINSALDMLRKESHNILHHSIEINEQNEEYFPGDETDDESISDEDAVSSEAIIALIQQMPAGYRAVLNLYAIENMSHKEIAKRLGISEGTSKSQLSKGRAFLKRLLNKKKPVSCE